MTKLLCIRNLGLLFLLGIIFTIMSINISPDPDYMKSDFVYSLGTFTFSVGPALLVLLIGLIVQWIRKHGQDLTNPQGISSYNITTYSSQNGESKKKDIEELKPISKGNITLPTLDEMEKLKNRKSFDKLDTVVKAGWKTIYIIAWIVFVLTNFFTIYGSLISGD